MVPEEELLALCQHSVAPFFDAQSVEGATGLQIAPRLHEYHLGRCVFIDTEFPAQTFTRNQLWLRRHDDSDHLMLQQFVRGRNQVVNGAQRYTEDCRNLYAVNLAFPLEAQSTESRVLLLVLPRDLVKEAVPHLAHTSGAVFEPEGAAARIFGDHMLSLARHLGDARAAEAPGIVNGTLGLLDALSLRHDAKAVSSVDAGFRAACRFIDRHLGDPTLGAKSVCQHLRCSRATLFRMFKSQGGVREHIQRRRLMACFAALTSPAHASRQIFDIALEFGFHSPSHFSHLFRAHFGMTPRDARDAGLQSLEPVVTRPSSETLLPGASRNDEAERMWQWAKNLASCARAPARDKY
jgi:AraC-like DNA-binding protein